MLSSLSAKLCLFRQEAPELLASWEFHPQTLGNALRRIEQSLV